MTTKLTHISFFIFFLIGCTNSKSILKLEEIKNQKITIKNYAKKSLFEDKEFKNVFGAGKSLYATQNNYIILKKRQNNMKKRYAQLCKNQKGHIELSQQRNKILNKIILDVRAAKLKKYTDIISTKLVPNNYHKQLLNQKNNSSVYINGSNFPQTKNVKQYTCISSSNKIFDYYITPIYYDLVKTLFNHKNVSGKITNDKERALWLGIDEAIYIY